MTKSAMHDNKFSLNQIAFKLLIALPRSYVPKYIWWKLMTPRPRVSRYF